MVHKMEILKRTKGEMRELGRSVGFPKAIIFLYSESNMVNEI